MTNMTKNQTIINWFTTLRRSVYGLKGDGYSRSIRVFGFRRIVLFNEIEDQHWSPSLTERRIEHGISFYGFRFSISKRFRVWKDNKLPHIELIKDI